MKRVYCKGNDIKPVFHVISFNKKHYLLNAFIPLHTHTQNFPTRVFTCACTRMMLP